MARALSIMQTENTSMDRDSSLGRDILSARYPMMIPEMVNITMKPGPANTWYCQPWPEKHQTQPPTASHPACKGGLAS